MSHSQHGKVDATQSEPASRRRRLRNAAVSALVFVRAALRWLATVASDAVLGLLVLAGVLLSPLRIGRVLRTVSIPRLREHRVRSTLTILGVSLGVAVLVAVSIVSDSVSNGVNATVDDLAGKADLQLSTASNGFDESLLERVHAVQGVYKVTPVVQQTATVRNVGARGDRLLVVGVDFLGTDDAYFREYSSAELSEIRKDPLVFLNSTSNVLVSRQLADRYHLKLRDKLRLGTAKGVQEFDIWGFIEGEGVGRAFGGAVVLMYYPAMQEAFGRGQHIDRIDVAIHDGEDAAVVSDRLQAALGGGFNIDRPTLRGERVTNMLAAVRTSLSFGSLIAIMTGGFLVFNTMAISLVQRKRELGTLRALGMTRSQLVQLLTLEGSLIGIVGSLLGVVFGIALSRLLLDITSRALTKVYLQQAITEVHIRWPILALGLVGGVAATIIASAVPALGAASTKVAQSLKAAAVVRIVANPYRVNGTDCAALGLLGAAYGLMQLPPHGRLPLGPLGACTLVMVAGRLLLPRVIHLVHAVTALCSHRVLGLNARLANDNLPRDVGRTSATATGLMAGAALMVGFATFDNSFLDSLNQWSQQTVPGDLFVTSGASISGLSSRNVPLTEDLSEELGHLPGVEAVQLIRMAEYDYHNHPVKLLSTVTLLFERYSHSDFLEGSPEDMKRMREGKVLVSENFSHRFDVHRGDSILLSGLTGSRSFEVAGVIIDYTSDIGAISFDREVYKEFWGDDRVDTFELHLVPGAPREELRRVIHERFGEQFDLFVLTNAEFRAEMVDAAAAIFSIMRVLEYIVLVVAALGIINSLLANILDRIREIGVLRALGMLRAQVGRMIVMEAALVGVVGVTAGALTGAVLGYVVLTHVTSIQTGWHFPYMPPWRAMFEIAVIALPISAIAGFYPARHASALVVRDALDYE